MRLGKFLGKDMLGSEKKTAEQMRAIDEELAHAGKLKSRVARKLLLALKRKEEADNDASVEGRLSKLSSDIQDVFENLNILKMAVEKD